MKKILVLAISLLNLSLMKAQGIDIDEFKAKLIIAEYLLTEQPTKGVIAQHVPVGYQLDSLKSYGYFFTDREARSVSIHMDFGNKQIIGIQFFEPTERYQTLIDFLKSEKKYKVANRTMDGKSSFFSDGTIAITLTLNELVMVNIITNLRQ